MMKFAVVLYIFLYLLTCVVCKRYDNHTLYRVVPVNKDHLEFLKNISEEYRVNYWRSPGILRKPVEFSIDPKYKETFLREAKKREIYLLTIMENVQSAFDKQTVKTYIRRQMNTYDWRHYYRVQDIYNWLMDLSKLYSDEMKVYQIGRTSEDRKIMAVKIILNGCTRRSSVIVEGGIHAREWIGPAFVTYLINEIIHAKISNNKALKDIAYTYEWYFVPVLNADGYEYSHTNDRLWRKNRNGNGVDINRNFNVAFGTVGVSRNSYDETYCGTHAFSEIEASAMANLVTSKKANLEYYLAFHSYGQYIILPYAHSKQHHDNYNTVRKIGEHASNLISKKYGAKYTVGTAFDTVGYMTSGVSGCWVKHEFRTPYVMTFEMRDTGAFGFALPPSYIERTCDETMAGLLYILEPRGSFRLLKDKKTPIISEEYNNKQTRSFSHKAFVASYMFCTCLFSLVMCYLE